MDNEETAGKPVALAVDDEESNLLVLKMPMRKEGYHLITASSGQEALEILSTTRVDVVLLDWMMPGMSGIEVLQKLKASEELRSIPVIMVTALSSPESIKAGLHAGANDYVTKPINRVELLARVAASVRESKLSEKLKKSNAELKELNGELEKKTRFIRSVFGRYMSDEVVDNLLESSDGLKLGGDKRKVTVVMSDLRGFAVLAEKWPPESVVEMLNDYFEVMTEVIVKHGGVINDFYGDALMVLFGAPILREDDTIRSLACAIEMQLAMKKVNDSNAEKGFPELSMGIGVNTGDVIAGNIGSSKRVKYAVVGGTVNLASRIESYTVGGQILVSQSTFNDAWPMAKMRNKMQVALKGIDESVTIYDIKGLGGEYDIHLPDDTDEPVDLARAIKVEFTELLDKVADGPFEPGEIVALAHNKAVLKMEREVAPLSNLKLRLGLDRQSSETECFYAKVVKTGHPEENSCLLHFTSLTGRVETLLKEALAE